jgi:hypothetical protein
MTYSILLLLLNSAISQKEVNIPVLPESSIEYYDSMQSSDAGIMLFELSYLSSKTTQEALNFYLKSPYIKNCEKNNTANNYQCKFKTYGCVTSGDLFIDNKRKNDKIEIYANYFCKQRH